MLIFRRGELGRMGGMKSHDCGEHQRTLENAQDKILHNIGHAALVPHHLFMSLINLGRFM